MAEPSLISDEMREAVGRDYRWATSFPVSRSDIRRWVIAVYYPASPPRMFWDEAYAATTRHAGIVAPEDFNPFAWMVAEEHTLSGQENPVVGPEVDLGLPMLVTRANIIAGLEVEHTKVRMRPGDVIQSTVRLSGYHEKEGRMGLMLFTTSEDRWTNQHGELVRTYRRSLIRYR